MNIKGYKITLSSSINLFLGLIEKVSSHRYFNLWKTLYINFRLFPFNQAIKLPIFVWGSVKIVSLIGRGDIKGKVKPGMILFGIRPAEEFIGSTKSMFSNQGFIIFHGPVAFYNGYNIRINIGKVLELGIDVMFSSNVSVFVLENISIGDYTRIANNCLLMSSDMHYSIDTQNREIHSNCAPIILGRNNWIAGNVRIMKGTITPDWTIVTSGSFLNKDYTKTIPQESIIGGMPAKLIKIGHRRVFSLESEGLLRGYFQKSHNDIFRVKTEVNLDEFCKR